MKRLLTLLFLTLILCVTVSAQNDIYKKCEKEKSVTTVYISKTMLQMIGDGKAGNVDSGAMALLKDKIDNVVIVNTDNAKGVKFLRDLRKNYMDNKNHEILMQINDPNSDMVMFRIPLNGSKNEYAISVLGKDNAHMIVIEGNLTIEDIARVTKGMGDKNGINIKKK